MKLSLDIGGSQTRLVECREGYDKPIRREMPSDFQRINTDGKILRNVKNHAEDFIFLKSSIEELNGCRFTKGDASNAHQGRSGGIDNQNKKVLQMATYIDALYAIAVHLLRNNISETDIESLFVCIPTAEFHAEDSADFFKDKIKGTHIVKFPILNKTVKFKINRKVIKVLPEGVVTLQALRLRKDDDAKLINKATGIVVDAGHRSTDITPMKAGRPVPKGAISRPEAGTVIAAQVASYLEREDKLVTESTVMEVIASGKLNTAETEDVGYAVRASKESLAGDLIKGINSAINLGKINIKEVQYMVCIGRPFSTNNKEGEPYYTGSLQKEILKGLPKGIKPIQVSTTGFENVDAMYEIQKQMSK